MATKDFTLYLYQTPYGSNERPQYTLTDTKDMHTHGYLLIRTQVLSVELPEPHDVRALKLAALEAKEKRLRAEFAAMVTELQRQKNELLAIENTVEASEVMG